MSARYERSKIAAQRKLDSENELLPTNPYDGTSLQTSSSLPPGSVDVPAGKAELQAAASREQVLEDAQYGGREVLEEEAQEEKEARRMMRKSNRRRTASSLTGSESLRGLRERVSIHGRQGGILGMESSR